MNNYEYLKKYIVKSGQRNDERNIFYKVSIEEIEQAEKKMERNFPKDLREFYKEIGYGFICKDDKFHTNRIMHPNDVADFYGGSDEYDYVDKSLYDCSEEFIFFDLGGEGDFLTIRIVEPSKGGIYYFGSKIAESLYDFLLHMYKETNYYLKNDL